MEPAVLIAFITAIGVIIASGVAAYSNVRKAARADIEDFRKGTSDDIQEIKELLAVNTLKVDMLWQIYAEEAIRDARNSGIIASRSRAQPTEKFSAIVGDELATQLHDEAELMSCVLTSSYDIAVELWYKHRRQLTKSSLDARVPLKETWAALIIICTNAIHEYRSAETDC